MLTYIFANELGDKKEPIFESKEIETRTLGYVEYITGAWRSSLLHHMNHVIDLLNLKKLSQ
jgi:hypothetical protein